MGKSRFAEEVASEAISLGFQVVTGRSFESDRTVPYAPLQDLLRGLFRTRSPQDLLSTLGPLAPWVGKLVPELAAGDTDRPPDADDREGERWRLFQALTQLVSHLAGERPVLLVFEDLHWSDDNSLDFLLHFLRMVGSLPVVVVMTYRGEERRPSLDNFLASLDRGRLAEEIHLSPLDRDEVEQMLGAILRQEPPIRSSLVDAIYALTEGNPFFIEEVLKALVASRNLYQAFGRWDWKAGGSLAIPRSVAHAIHQRVAQLSPGAREAALLAAVAGRRFDFPILETLTSQGPASLLTWIKELIDAQLVVEESRDHFAFRHALTQQTIYGELLARERQALHLAVGGAIERLYGATLEVYAGDLAYHFFEAEAWQKALDNARRAGERSQALFAPVSAVEHFTRALEASRHLTAEPPRGLHRSRALAFQTLGDFEGALDDLEREREVVRGRDQSAEWEVLIDLGFLWTGRDYDRAGEYFRSAFRLAEAMDDRVLRARSLNRLGNWHLNMGQSQQALLHHKQALALFQDMNDPRGTSETLDLLGMTSYLTGDLIKGTRYYREANELFQALGDRYGLVSALATLPLRGNTYNSDTMVSAESDLSACVKDGERAQETARQIGWRTGEIYAMFNLAFCLGPMGQYDQALQFARRALRDAQEIEHRQWMAAAHSVLGAIHLDLLALTKAREHLERALALARETASSYWVHIATGLLASTHVQAGELGLAQSTLEETRLVGAGQAPGERQSICSGAELALARGDAQGALRIVDQLIATAASVGGGRRVLRLSRLRGEVLAHENRYEEAEEELQAARRMAEEQAVPGMLWRVYLALGRLYRATRRHKASREAMEAARRVTEEVAVRIGDEALRETFRETIQRMLPPTAPPSERRIAKEAYGGLTSREREVARLIAGGRSNRQLAHSLVVSERTIETHVAHILSKLAFTSRTQIAAWAVEKGLAGSSE